MPAHFSGDVEPFVVRAAVRGYRICTRALPRGLRSLYGPAMEQQLSDEVGAAFARRGARGVLVILLRAMADVLFRSIPEHRYERRLDAARNIHSTYVPTGERMLRILNDIRVAARTLARRPGFSMVVMITLALGIGANIAIFAIVNAVLIKPLPYPASERIMVINHHAPGLNFPDMDNSPGTILNYATNARAFSAVSAVQPATRNLTGSGDPVQLDVGEVTPGVFDVLRVSPALGRRLLPEDTAAGAPAVALLTHTGWMKYFGGKRDIVGRSVELDGVTTRIIGVMPKGFAYPKQETMALLPLRLDYGLAYSSFGIHALARLADGVTLDGAQRDLAALQSHIVDYDKEFGAPAFLKQVGWSADATPLRDTIVKDAAKTLWIVLGTVGFLLLVACASVANLFLVRAEGRRREVGVRFALGASRGRVASTFIAESLILGIAGGAWGMLIAVIALRGLIAAAPPELPRLNEIGIDGRVILFASMISVIAGILFGVLPLPHRIQRPLADLVRGGRGDTDGRDRQLLRKTLIVAQIALALMLLVGSGLMLRSYARLRAVDPGVQPDGLLTVGMSLGKVQDRAAAAALYMRVADRVAGLPGKPLVGVTNSLPIDPSGLNGGSFRVRSAPTVEGKIPPVTMYAGVSNGYFAAMGTPVTQGRDFERTEIDHGSNVIIVNQTLAHGLLKDHAIGEEISFGEGPWFTVVGVVKDMHTFGLRQPIKPMAYLPLSTSMKSAQLTHVYLAVRTSGDPARIAPDVRAVVRNVAPQVPVTTTRTMNEIMSKATADTSLTMTVLGLAAGVAMLLGAIGLYGVIGYVVTQRTREIGVRIALGAEPGSIGTMVLRQGIVLALVGITVGVAGAMALTRLMSDLLFGVQSHDPLTFVSVPLILMAVSAIAAYLPARRAAATSPMEALRNE